VAIALLLALAMSAAPPPAPASAPGWSSLAVAGSTRTGDPLETVRLYRPSCRATERPRLVIALAGWNHSAEEWVRHSATAPLADRSCVTVAAPSLKKSVYETRYFAETKNRWGPTPGARWVGAILLPALRAELGLPPSEPAAVIGYSTGGRGAIMVAGLHPGFAFAASLSGTYDLSVLSATTGEYRIHEHVYGPRRRFSERWREESCTAPAVLAGLDTVELFLAHGARDPVVPAEQMARMAAVLGGRSGRRPTVTLDPTGAHDWAFWNAQLPAVFDALDAAFRRRARP
jgi:S-formylglutathione hydrolase FrmB